MSLIYKIISGTIIAGLVVVGFGCNEPNKRFELPRNGPLIIGFSDTSQFIKRVDFLLMDSIRKDLCIDYSSIAYYKDIYGQKIFDDHTEMCLAKPFGEPL